MPPYQRITHRHHHHHHHRRPSKWMLLTFVMLTGAMVITAAAAADDEKSSTETKTIHPSPPPAVKTISSNTTPRDEIYIDDEGIEGSGGRGEIHDDLEKEPDYSGSGFGPDDEDSATNHHSNSNTNNRHHPSSSIVPNSGIISNTNPTSRKDSTRVTEYDLGGAGGNTGGGHISGSGDGADNDDDDDDDDDNDNDDDDADDDDYVHGITDTDDDNNNNNAHTDKTDDHNSHIDPYDKHDDKTNGLIDVDNDKQKIDEDDDDDHDIYTDVTDLNESDAKLPDRSGDSNRDILKPNNEIDLDSEHKNSATDQNTNSGNEVLIMNAKGEDRTTSFFAQPGILAAVIGGAVVGLLCAILVVMFIVYRMRKKDEGSYALDEPKRSPAVNSYAKNGNNREFYA